MRASSLPRYLTCPSSEEACEHPYDPPSSAAGLGTAVHAAMAAHVAGEEPDLPAIAQRHGVDLDDVERLYAYGRLAWRELAPSMPDARAEERLVGLTVEGTADVICYGDATHPMAIVDWKTNWVERDYIDQLLGYVSAATDAYGWNPDHEFVRVAVVWLRALTIEYTDVRPTDVQSLLARVAEAKRDVGRRYAPGEACVFCKRQHVCGARNEYLRASAEALAPMSESVSVNAHLASLWDQSKALQNALNRYNAALKLALADGPLKTSNGVTLELTEAKRDKLNTVDAWPVLTQWGFSPDELGECCSISKTSALNVIGRTAPRGQKGKRRTGLLNALRDAGAVHQVTYQTVKATRGQA